MLIIAIGSFKSLEEILRQMRKIHIEKDYEGLDSIEKMEFNDAWQFPLYAGCTLTGLYYAMEYFGKESVNYFILFYIGVGGSAGIKALLTSIVGDKFSDLDKKYVIDFEIKMIDLKV